MSGGGAGVAVAYWVWGRSLLTEGRTTDSGADARRRAMGWRGSTSSRRMGRARCWATGGGGALGAGFGAGGLGERRGMDRAMVRG